MSTLGLSGEPSRDENIFKRIFWPANQPYEADSLGQQGMWVCLVVAVISVGVSAATGHPVIALLLLLFYGLGGMGVREHSVAAAIVVALGYLLSGAMVVLLGRPPGLLDIAVTCVLLANIRGTVIASRWKKVADPELFPQRLSTTFTDKLIDQWPARFWPKGRFVFFAVAAMYMVLFALGVVGTMRLRAEQRLQQQQLLLQQETPTDQLQAGPRSR